MEKVIALPQERSKFKVIYRTHLLLCCSHLRWNNISKPQSSQTIFEFRDLSTIMPYDFADLELHMHKVQFT